MRTVVNFPSEAAALIDVCTVSMALEQAGWRRLQAKPSHPAGTIPSTGSAEPCRLVSRSTVQCPTMSVARHHPGRATQSEPLTKESDHGTA